IIVVNDGSTDDFAGAIKPYLDKIKIINQENRGRNNARNRGFAAARGQLLLFCDADIFMYPDMLDAMVQSQANHPEAAYVYSSFKWGWVTFKLWPFDERKLKKMNYIHTTSMVRREHFPGFDENIKKFQDWDLWLTMLEKGHRGWWIDEVLFEIKERKKHGLSKWLPSFVYKLPWLFPKTVKNYQNAVKIIRKKHNI
ncbi:glycosyltransferase family 2 protein, partial [Patescibacteria group bacterium]|nr:glycosyltransferase family 2 protein [Patescibacteria group bacterium]